MYYQLHTKARLEVSLRRTMTYGIYTGDRMQYDLITYILIKDRL